MPLKISYFVDNEVLEASAPAAKKDGKVDIFIVRGKLKRTLREDLSESAFEELILSYWAGALAGETGTPIESITPEKMKEWQSIYSQSHTGE
jgi:hypothetical protein